MTITLTREEAQQVLDALKHLCAYTAAIKGYDGHKVQPPINMLKAKLKQPKNAFNPDWDAMAVMVQEQQRMAKRIEELTQLVTSQGIRLMDAEARAECDGGQCGIGGYCNDCPKTQPEPEPVAWQSRMRPDWEENGWTQWKDCPKEQADSFWKVPHLHDWVYEARALYTAPPQQPEQTEYLQFSGGMHVVCKCDKCVAQPEPEPVAYGVLDDDGQINWTAEYPFSNEPGWPDSVPLYTAPPQREWQGLTDEEISELIRNTHNTGSFVRAIEAKLREKNT